jgi:glucuronokinase
LDGHRLLASTAVESRARSASGKAFARAGLLGNPSDAYAGKAIAFTFGEFHTRVDVVPASHQAVLNDTAAPLIEATIARFQAHTGHTGRSPGPLRVHCESNIPFQAGLSGSSAIVIATLRALSGATGARLPPFEQAEIALAVEVEDLGIPAGPMDRVVQSYEGLYAMDFREPRTADAYRRLDPALLPPLLIAFDRHSGAPSGTVHADTHRRWREGDPGLRRAVTELAALADAGIDALERRDIAELGRLVDRNFDLRCKWFPVARRDRDMVGLARSHAASAKQCGSGGACLVLLRDDTRIADLEAAYRAAGFESFRPTLEDSG